MIDYNYGEQNNSFRTSQFEELNISLPGNVDTTISFKDACVNMAKSIMHYYPNMDFALSGGIWSHLSYMSFVEAGYRPPIKVYRLPRDLNDTDVENAQALARYVGSPIDIIKISLKEEILDVYVDAAKKYQTYGFSDSIMARMAETNNNDIFISDSIILKRNIEPGWRFILDEGADFYWHRFNYNNRHNIIRSFFTGSAEILYQFLKLPVVQDIIEDRIKNKLSTNTSLKRIFNDAGWNLPDRHFLRFSFTDVLPEFTKRMNAKIILETGYKKRLITIPCNKLIDCLENEGYKCSFV